jgi:LAGLIDADG endonuclease
MNKGRTKIDETALFKLIEFKSINNYWLLGFIEGEGTFGIKNLVPYFQVCQHNRSIFTLKAISSFLSKLPKIHKETIYNNTPSTSLFINKKSNVSSITINDIDILYDYIVPFLESLSFQSRKSIDFSY